MNNCENGKRSSCEKIFQLTAESQLNFNDTMTQVATDSDRRITNQILEAKNRVREWHFNNLVETLGELGCDLTTAEISQELTTRVLGIDNGK